MSAEQIRVLTAIDDPEVMAAVRRALPREDGYELVSPPSRERALESALTGRPDVILAEVDDTRGGSAGSPTFIDLLLARAGPRPVIAVAPEGREKAALRAVSRGCVDRLDGDSLHPEVIRRAVRYAMATARAERRRLQAERALTESEQRYRSLFEQSRDAIYMTERDGEIVELNQAALELLGYESGDLIGQDVRSIYADATDRQRFLSAIADRDEIRDFEVRLRRRDGRDIWCLVSSWPRRDPRGRVLGYQGIIHDITDRKAVEERLTHEAFHDPLTRLPNRALFMDRLERAVARRRRGEERDLAVLFLDLDRFKVVNDSLGHLVGDELLRRMGRVLAEAVREEDTVARIGGDEFAILIDGIDDPADATHVAERIQERLRTPFRLAYQDVFSSLSIGIAMGGAEVESPEDLLREADSAMYRAKELGPARYQIFDRAVHSHAITLLQLETDLRLALERDEFVLHYQPVVELAGGSITGFEALVRWQHPQEGLIFPQSFIPVAEDSGLIAELGEWVLRAALRQLREWQIHRIAADDIFVSVNVSPRQFTSGRLVDSVRGILDEAGVAGPCLRLEVTEAAIMRNPGTAAETLNALRDLGVDLCIDDFGTGYSSLHYLHEFPIRTLKIDRVFIRRLEEEAGGSVVQAVLALAEHLQMRAVAVGVETEGQLARLRALQAESAQGFLFSGALEPEAIAPLLQSWEARPDGAPGPGTGTP
jgi:diguanylate cyclase (GGDEF)-like protein/PAS domain S-box-containing protein